LEKSTSAPPEKNPSDAHAHKHVNYTIFVKNCVVLHHSGKTVQQHQCGKQFIAGRQIVHCAFCQKSRNSAKFIAKLQIIYEKQYRQNTAKILQLFFH